MEAQPAQSTALSYSSGDGGSGTQRLSEEKGGAAPVKIEVGEKEEGSPSIKLGLGIDGKYTWEKPVMKHGKCLFTTAQLHELQLQALIFNYIESGTPVPNDLVLPVWKNGINPIPIGIDYRCRRTDGKKWRCSKNVIPDQKYCEQHMHRGCRRSRKPVEHSQITSPDSTLSKNSNNISENSKNLSAPAVGSQCLKTSFGNTSTSHETTASTAIDSNNIFSNSNSISTNATTSSSTTVMERNDNDGNICKRNKSSQNISEKVEEKFSVSENSIINRSSKIGDKAAVNSISPSLDFSPKSFLQALGCSTSRVYKNEIESEPERCRRTDGKRWRCSRDVIPCQKYCARHMHRGMRKHVEVPHPVAIPTIADCPSSRLTTTNKPSIVALNTSLSISIPSPQLITQEKSMSSGSETTISDTTTAAFDNQR